MNNGDEYTHYSLIMEWDPTDSIYVVTVPELPGCMTHGATIGEAARQAKDAIESWIDAARAQGQPTPEPRYFDIDRSSHIAHSQLNSYPSEKAS